MVIGIDISKDTFDAAFAVATPAGSEPRFRIAHFTNAENGHRDLIEQLTPGTDLVVMEATGPYWYRLAITCTNHGIGVAVVNPLQIKRFGQMKLRRAKTDRADARLIALYGIVNQPPQFTPPQGFLLLCKQLVALETKLGQIAIMVSNQAHAFSQMPELDPLADTIITELQGNIRHKVKLIEQRLDRLLLEHCPTQYAALCSVPAIGKKAAAILITLTGNFQLFSSAKQVAAFAGICPQLSQSGTSLPLSGRMAKRGSAPLRRILYMCAVAALRWNNDCITLFQRLVAKGKPKKTALIAVANKLLRQCFAVAKSGRTFVEPHLLHACF